MVSTPLKNISQNGNLPQIGVKITNRWNHHPGNIGTLSDANMALPLKASQVFFSQFLPEGWNRTLLQWNHHHHSWAQQSVDIPILRRTIFRTSNWGSQTPKFDPPFENSPFTVQVSFCNSCAVASSCNASFCVWPNRTGLPCHANLMAHVWQLLKPAYVICT